jgi:hypothetical protein
VRVDQRPDTDARVETVATQRRATLGYSGDEAVDTGLCKNGSAIRPGLRYDTWPSAHDGRIQIGVVNTMKGACPPSSSATFLMVDALSHQDTPHFGGPVRTNGPHADRRSEPSNGVELGASAVRMFSTPAGIPARNASSPIASAVSGVALRAHYGASAAPAPRVIM